MSENGLAGFIDGSGDTFLYSIATGKISRLEMKADCYSGIFTGDDFSCVCSKEMLLKISTAGDISLFSDILPIRYDMIIPLSDKYFACIAYDDSSKYLYLYNSKGSKVAECITDNCYMISYYSSGLFGCLNSDEQVYFVDYENPTIKPVYALTDEKSIAEMIWNSFSTSNGQAIYIVEGTRDISPISRNTGMRILKLDRKGNVLKSLKFSNYLGWYTEPEIMSNGNILIPQNKESQQMFEYSVMLLDNDLNVIDTYKFPEAFVGRVFRYDASLDMYIGLSKSGTIYSYSSSSGEIKCIYINNENCNANPGSRYCYEDFRLYNGKMIALKKKNSSENNDISIETIDIGEYIENGIQTDTKLRQNGRRMFFPAMKTLFKTLRNDS